MQKKNSWNYDKNYDPSLKNIETKNLIRLTYATGYKAVSSNPIGLSLNLQGDNLFQQMQLIL